MRFWKMGLGIGLLVWATAAGAEVKSVSVVAEGVL
jgi:hypothetical protein